MEAPTLLGLSADIWNGIMIASLVLVAFTTACAVSAAKREATAARDNLQRYQARTAAEVEDAKANAASANERAAKFGKEAAEANLKAEVLKKELGWREVTPDQADKLRAALGGKSMPINIFWAMGDPEGSHFAHVLAKALREAGLVVAGGNPIGQLARSIRDAVRFLWTLGMGCARTRLILRFFHRQETGTFRTRLRDGTWRAGAQAPRFKARSA